MKRGIPGPVFFFKAQGLSPLKYIGQDWNGYCRWLPISSSMGGTYPRKPGTGLPEDRIFPKVLWLAPAAGTGRLQPSRHTATMPLHPILRTSTRIPWPIISGRYVRSSDRQGPMKWSWSATVTGEWWSPGPPVGCRTGSGAWCTSMRPCRTRGSPCSTSLSGAGSIPYQFPGSNLLPRIWRRSGSTPKRSGRCPRPIYGARRAGLPGWQQVRSRRSWPIRRGGRTLNCRPPTCRWPPCRSGFTGWCLRQQNNTGASSVFSFIFRMNTGVACCWSL